MLSIQTFGSYAANFHPHVHALVTDGAYTEEGEFLQLPYFDARLVEKSLDQLELIHALTTQIPDPGQHLVRYYGWYSNRSKGAHRRRREAGVSDSLWFNNSTDEQSGATRPPP